ncbi:hypothetical protein M5D96_011359, partial [Drosophila gunungcola]
VIPDADAPANWAIIDIAVRPKGVGQRGVLVLRRQLQEDSMLIFWGDSGEVAVDVGGSAGVAAAAESSSEQRLLAKFIESAESVSYGRVSLERIAHLPTTTSDLSLAPARRA